VKYFANPIEKKKPTYYRKGKVMVTFFLNVRADLILQQSGGKKHERQAGSYVNLS
jgi:hypothetical protein